MSEAETARVLIVDDEPAQVRALCQTLRDQGYDTTGFTSSRLALEALREGKFDLLLADLMMPELNGIALLRAARDRDPDLVGVIMTGAGTVSSAVEAMKAGAIDYILKPFELSVILPVLSRALSIRRLRLENAKLEACVRQRTTELEAANKELEAFSHSVSHDLRAPLRAISGYTEMLLEGKEDRFTENDERLLRHICSSAEHLSQLIEGLLSFSRLGRQPLAKKHVDLNRLVQEVIDEQMLELPGRQIDLRLGHLPARVADPTLLRQVFVNLLSNAFKYTRRKEPAVVEVGSMEQEGEWVFFVRDNGAGFDMRYAEKLFEVFQRLHSNREFEGNGVGLSIVQRIVQRHGGRIWAQAEVDRGATFYFTLPEVNQAA